MFKAIPKEIREQIIARIKNDGVTVSQAAIDAGISVKTIYTWLSNESGKADVNILEFNRLKRENEGLYELVGKLTAELHKSKKGRL